MLAESPGMCSRLRGFPVSHLEKLTYYIRKQGTGWLWQLLGPDNTILTQGCADDPAKARAQAMLFAFEVMGREPAKPAGMREAP